MEAQIKEEATESSLCFETSGENLASLTLVEKYDRYLQKDISDPDSDGDFFPDDTVLKEEYAQLRSEADNYTHNKRNHRLSTGLPGKYRSSDANISVIDDDSRNGTADEASETSVIKNGRSGLTGLKELIEKLELVRKCDPENGNSIFCTESELEAIQERYGEILDFMHEMSNNFERTSSSKDLSPQGSPSDNDGGQQREEKETPEKSEHSRLLAEKLELVQQDRDRFYEVEQQVREQIEQLELVERYKMESVG